MSIRRIVLALFVAFGFVGGLVAQPSDAEAATMTWRVKSMYKYKVQVAFFSENRGWVWPGKDRAWDLNDYKTHRIALTCNAGEKICFGAWVTGNASIYWGVGYNNSHGCSTCCAICGEGDPVRQILNP